MSDNDYGYTADDAENKGGGERSALPRAKYTGTISRAKSKLDAKKKAFLGFGISITHGKFKNALAFENYLPLSRNENAFRVARRNSFFQAIGLEGGTIPPGVPGGPDASVLDGTYVDFQVEHEFEDVPDQEHSLSTSKSSKTRWVKEGWEDCLDENGNLVKDPDGNVFDEPVKPKAIVTFYSISNEFAGLGGVSDDDGGDDEAADDDDWGK